MSINHNHFTDQQLLWDEQHAHRGGEDGLEGRNLLADTPNESAVLMGRLVVTNAVIAEIGSANGRDARYWASQGHNVHCMDFSPVALDQLASHAERQGVRDKLNPILFDANTGKLPEEIEEINGFYARSALHVDDETLTTLLTDVNDHLQPGGIVLIEGKTTHDPKIARSEHLGNGLAIDPEENGHVRRVWTHESVQRICNSLSWTALEQSTYGETWIDTDASFLRLVARK